MVIPLMLSMSWKNSPTIFFMNAETVVNLANADLHSHRHAQTNPMYDRAEKLAIHPMPLLNPAVAAIPRDPMLGNHNADLLAYIDILVENLLVLVQGPAHHCQNFQHTPFHYLY